MADKDRDFGSETSEPKSPPVGKPATAHEKFLFDWAHESYKASIPLFNDTLSKVLTLSTALTGGGLALLDKPVMPGWAKIVALSLFFLAILACMAGMFPVGGKLALNPEMIRTQAERAIGHKKRSLIIAGSLLATGLMFAIVLAAIQLYQPKT